MTERKARAHAALVAICAILAVDYLDARDHDTWAASLRDILPDCEGCPEALERLRVAASGFAYSGPSQRPDDLMRIRFAVRVYYRMQAGTRLQAWRERTGESLT